jgi:hypothetical protein
VCVVNHYVLGNMYDRKTPYMIQYVFNVQRELGRVTALEIGYLGSRSKRLERMFDANEVTPGPGSPQSRRPYPEFTKIQEIGNVAEAKVQLTGREGSPDGLTMGSRSSSATRCRKSEDNGSGIRVLNGDALFPQDSRCFDCEWGPSIFDVRHRLVHRCSTSCRSGRASRSPTAAWAGDLRRLADQRDRQQVERLPARSRAWHRHSQHRAQTYRPNLVSGRIPTTAADDPAVVQHRRVRPPGRVHLRQRRRNIVIGPGIFTTDASLIRNFFFGGTKSLQFRLEAFNLFNNPSGATRRWRCRARSTDRSTPRASRCASCSSA